MRSASASGFHFPPVFRGHPFDVEIAPLGWRSSGLGRYSRASIALLRCGLSCAVISVTAIRHRPPFDGSPFLVVVPGLNQQKRNPCGTIVVSVVEVECVVESLSTAALH